MSRIVAFLILGSVLVWNAVTEIQGEALSERPGDKCLGCNGPADPKAQGSAIESGPRTATLPGRDSLEGTVAASERQNKSGISKSITLRGQKKTPPAKKEPDTWFNLLFGGEYWNKGREITFQLFDTLREVRPQVLHASVFGPELLSGLPTAGQLVGITPVNPKGITTVKGYLAWWKKFNAEAHRLGIKVQSTFSLTLIFDNQPRDKGWFKYYNEQWEGDVLGPRPVKDPIDLLQRDRFGKPLTQRVSPDGYGYLGCPNNPHWRQLMKQLVRAGIEAGFDGYMVQFNYRYDCLCSYCQQSFRDFLAEKYSPETLRDRFGIDNVAKGFLDTTRGRENRLLPSGWEAVDRPGPLAMEARQFTDESVKSALDDVFIGYGRSLKPDLMVSTWMHHRNFLVPGVDYRPFEEINDERRLLSPVKWARGEDYVWYCLGVITSRLTEHVAGDASLSAKFIYSLGKGKPFVAGKYDYARPRLSLAEAWAHRGIGLVLDRDEFREILAPYYAFVHRYREFYYPSEPYTEVALVFPRRGLYDSDTLFLPVFDRFGHALLEDHVLFDVLMDQRLSQIDLSRYQAILLPTTIYLSPTERRQLQDYRKKGGTLLIASREIKPEEKGPELPPRQVLVPATKDPAALAVRVRQEIGGKLSSCDAPWTVQMTVWQQASARRLIVHLVNYDRDEAAAGLENPRPTSPITVRLTLPKATNVERIKFVTPEQPEPEMLAVTTRDGQVSFQTPRFLVYGIAVLEYGLVTKER